MKPLAVIAWSMITPFGDSNATFDAICAQRAAFSSRTSRWKLRNSLAAVIPEPAWQTRRDGQWQRYLAIYCIREVMDTFATNHNGTQLRRAFVFATSYGHLIDDCDCSESMSSWARDCVQATGCDLEPVVVGSGCSSGSDALGVAAAMLDYGLTDVAIVVAVDIVTEAKRIAHSTLRTMTSGCHMPFDIHRSGMLLGEGSAAVALMRSRDCREHRGELIGVGSSNDAFALTSPDPTGVSVRLALDRALLSANLNYNDLALYLGHGTATEINDDIEAKVVDEAFAQNDTLTVVGTKGALGHSLGACGLIEFILLLQMLNKRFAPAMVGMADPIDSISARVPGPNGRVLSGPYGVSVTLGFGGFNTAVIGRAS